MLSKENACDSERLEMFLEHQLDKHQTLALESHLGTCHQCRQHLEDLAASPDFWSGVEKRLREPGDAFNDDGEESGVDDPSQVSLHERLTSTRITKTRSPGDDRLQTPGAIISFLKQWLLPTDDPDSLGRISGYEVTGIIGVGGMSVVLKGFDRSLNRYVAIKVLATHLAACGAARKRFAREARAAAAVVHDNVLAIHAIDELMDLPYLVMPYVRGESLETRLTRQGPLGTVEVLRIAHQIAAGLAAAHSQGLVHRDIKPANILLDEGSERLKIADFGLARAADDASLTHSGSITGTPLYMSPEQARGENVDQRSDIFSFGTLLYTLCAGHPPFRAETPYGIIRRICDDQPRPIQQSSSGIPLWLSAIIESMMEKDIHRRCNSTLKLSELFMKGLTYVQNPGGDPLPDELQKLVPFRSIKRLESGTMRRVAVVTLLLAGTLATLLIVANLQGPRETPNELAADKSKREQAPDPPMLPLNIDPDTGDRQGDAVTLPDEKPIRSGLFYTFSTDETQYYSVFLEIDRTAYRLVIDGLLAMTPDEVNSEFAEYVYQLQLSQDIQWKRTATIPLSGASHETRQLGYCEPRGRFKVDHRGKIMGRSNASRVPGEWGPILDWVFPVLGEGPGSDWSDNRNLELYLTDQSVSSPLDVMGFDMFNFLQSRDSIFVDRRLNYRREEHQETDESFHLIHFDGKDIPEREFQVDGHQPRQMKGWFRFDTASGMMSEISAQRSGPDVNTIGGEDSFDVNLQLKRLEPDEAESIRSRLSSNKK